MRLKGIIEVTGIASACFVFAVATVSCDSERNRDEQLVPAEIKKLNDEPKKGLSRAEMFEAEFRQVLENTNGNITADCWATCDLLDKVLEIPDGESLRVLERFLGMALATSLEPIVDFPSKYDLARPMFWAREAWFEKMFYVSRQTFYTYMQLREDPFADWDILFEFFGKFTNEFTMVEKCQPTLNGPKREYMLELKGKFKTFVHVVRDIDLKHHKTKPTEKQKAEIFRRFEELEKYVETLVPPRKTGAEEQQTLNRNDAPIVPARKEEFDANRFHPQLVM